MIPFLVYGLSNKAQYNYARQIAKQEQWNFCEVERQDFETELNKSSLSTNFYDTPNLIYISGVDSLSPQKLEKLFSLIENSPHRYFFSAHNLYKLSKEFRDKCHPVKIGEVSADPFFEALEMIMQEPNREKVREYLSKNNIKVETLLGILQDNAWKVSDPRVLSALENCQNLLYKVDSEFLYSILAYSFPAIRVPIIFVPKRNLYKEEEAIIEKLRRRLKLSGAELLDTYQAIRKIAPKNSLIVDQLGLSDKEQKFLGVVKPSEKIPVKPSPQVEKLQSLSRWL